MPEQILPSPVAPPWPAAPHGRGAMRERLRRSTATLHRRAEAAMALESRLASAESYRLLLCRLTGLHRPLEAALARIDWRGTGIDIAARRKCRWLEADLRDLGTADTSLAVIPSCPFLPRLDTAAAGLGALYVSEGASLGGRIVLRRASQRLGMDAGRGGRFFTGYGTATGVMWRACVTALDTLDWRSPAADEAQAAARAMFMAFEAWLSMPRSS
ncbi:biliverdin-producing heme oxygenase [Geminicoccaceae bacterium 1502E]|nr:biliverdin-producing heme oxygenase [Geminicoccaceae bacterium 1502E]